MNQDGLYQNEIAEKIYKNKSTIKRTLDKLEKKEAIRKVRDKQDARKYNIYLNKKVKALKQSFMQGLIEEQNWFEDCLGKQEYKSFMKQLNFLYQKTQDSYKMQKEN